MMRIPLSSISGWDKKFATFVLLYQNQSQSQSNTVQCLHVMSCITLIRLSLRVVAYCVVAVESAGRELPIAFLERIKDDFYKRYGTGKGKTANAKGLNREFGYLFMHIYPIYISVYLSFDECF